MNMRVGIILQVINGHREESLYLILVFVVVVNYFHFFERQAKRSSIQWFTSHMAMATTVGARILELSCVLLSGWQGVQ